MRILLLFFTITILLGCGFVDEKGIISSCSKQDLDLLGAIENGDLEALKKYIQSGGDKEFRCGIESSGRGLFPGQRSLLMAVSLSESYKIISYYFSLGVSDENKQELLHYYYQSEKDAITKLIINSNAYFSSVCQPLDSLYFNRLIRLGYDVDLTDPEMGNTLFLDYCGCPCSEGNDAEIIESLEYLIELGADVDKVNNSGQNRLDLAENKAILTFLKTL